LTIATGETIGRWVAGEPINHEHEQLRLAAFDEAAKGHDALRRWWQRLTEQQRVVLRPFAGNLSSAAHSADNELEQERQARDEQERDRPSGPMATGSSGRAATPEQPFHDPFAEPGDEAGATGADPFGYSDLREPDGGESDGAGLVVPLCKMSDGGPDWEETAAAMRERIATLTDPADTALSGRFKQANRDTLDQMRDGDRDGWNSVELSLADRDRELRERGGK
jgi:hypothetical protein